MLGKMEEHLVEDLKSTLGRVFIAVLSAFAIGAVMTVVLVRTKSAFLLKQPQGRLAELGRWLSVRAFSAAAVYVAAVLLLSLVWNNLRESLVVWAIGWGITNIGFIGVALMITRGRWPVTRGGTEIFVRDLLVRIPVREFAIFWEINRSSSDVYLGISMLSGKLATIRRANERLHVMVGGGSGQGKTTVAKGIINDAIRMGYPIIFIDPKGSHFNVEEISSSAISTGLSPDRFYLVSLAKPEASCFFNPLTGGAQAMAELIMGAFVWSEEFYRVQANKYLGLLMPVLEFYKLGQVTLQDVHDALCRDEYLARVKKTCEEVSCVNGVDTRISAQARDAAKSVETLNEMPQKDLAGLQGQMAKLCQKEFGYLYSPPGTEKTLADVITELRQSGRMTPEPVGSGAKVKNGKTVVSEFAERLSGLLLPTVEERTQPHLNPKTAALEDVIRNGGFIYFQVPIMELSETGRFFVRLVMGNLKNLVSAIYTKKVPAPEMCAVIIDEFGQFADENFPVFLEQARESRCAIHMFFQSIGNLYTVGPHFMTQLEDSTGVKIFMNTSSVEGAEEYSNLCGTVDSVEASRQYVGFGPFSFATGLGNERPTKQMRVEHDVFKRLGVGQAVVLERNPNRVDLVQIWNPSPQSKPDEPETAMGARIEQHLQLDTTKMKLRAKQRRKAFTNNVAWSISSSKRNHTHSEKMELGRNDGHPLLPGV